jgi:hypothetical protein
MKKHSSSKRHFLLLIFFGVLFIASCKKNNIVQVDLQPKFNNDKIISEKVNISSNSRLANGSYTCNDVLSGVSPIGRPNGSYIYPDYPMDFSGVTLGATITIICTSLDVPNKFTVKDASGNPITNSGWRGVSTTTGPWGASLNLSGNYSITFTKGTSNIYYFSVETVIANNGTDAWNAQIVCTIYTPPSTNVDTVKSYKCGNPNLLYTDRSPIGQPNGNFHYYKKMDLSQIQAGTTINVLCTSLDVPNKFTISDATSQPIANSGWRGVSSTSGPWGASLNLSGNYLFTFIKGAGSIYYLHVETVLSNNGQDTWTAQIYCQ